MTEVKRGKSLEPNGVPPSYFNLGKSKLDKTIIVLFQTVLPFASEIS